ncbi:carbohydrate kinase family protein [Nonomuraea fuscirosea]
MPCLGVIGNISIDTTRYPDGRRHVLIGGAALYVASAAARAGATTRPISVAGSDLASLHAHAWPATLDLSGVAMLPGPSCRFDITYGSDGQVIAMTAEYGAATTLTAHALTLLARSGFDHWHVCCRRPLDVGQVLDRLMMTGQRFSLDFHLASAAEQITAAKAALPHAEAVFVNAAEYQLLDELVAVNDLPAVVVSDGPGAVILLRHGQPVGVELPERHPVVEVTGAGDTLAGTFLAEFLHGIPGRDALAAAVTAASRHTGTPGVPYNPP